LSHESLPDPPPAWVRLSASAVRALPFGRYRAAGFVGRFSRTPFRAALPADLGGYSFACDLRDSIAREVCFTGRYEPQETRLALAILRAGMTVVDAGANWGYFTLLSAHVVGRRGRVVALEPHPALSALLQANVRANRLAQVNCLRLAAGATRTVASFAGFAPDDGNWGVSRELPCGDADAAEFSCDVRPLDDLLDGLGIERVHLVKIDVEGGEAEVVHGMTRGLRRGRYRHVLLELHPALLASRHRTVESCVQPLRDAGYTAWWIDHSPRMHRASARSCVPIRRMLLPFERGFTGAWPHLLCVAPEAGLPE
jgi:FkbM family methyltransferase